MASHSLQSASTYLNNLLLARGLLQDGIPIDFTLSKPKSDDQTANKSQIINLIHDLVIRRDKDAQHRELLVSTIRTDRIEEAQRVQEVQKLRDENADLSRVLATATAQSRTLKTAVHKAETQAKELKEQMLKLKSMLDQVRAKCISDVRKRDVELEKLKTHLTGLQRGKREASGMKVNVIHSKVNAGFKDHKDGHDINSADWSLEKETNDFLAALVNETSTENVTLRAIIENTTKTLTHLTGLHMQGEESAENVDNFGIPGQYREARQETSSAAQQTLISCEVLGDRLNTILEHCKSILKDPSFVPIEEVQIREEEIVKLRIGWEKMANKWKEAVTMMDSWRRRVLEGEDVPDVDELSSLTFGRSIAVMPNGDAVLSEDEENTDFLSDHQCHTILGKDGECSGLLSKGKGDSTSDHANRVLDESEDHPDRSSEHNVDCNDTDESDLELPPPSAKRLASSPARRGIKLPRSARTLGEGSGNNKHSRELRNQHSLLTNSGDSGIGSLDGSNDENYYSGDAFLAKNHRANSRRYVQMTVEQKLAKVEAEAKEAEQNSQQVGRKRKSRDSAAQRSNRRRSTLSPEELASLMAI